MGPVATAIYDALNANGPLMTILTGGLHARGIDRGLTPDAFDVNGTPLPAATVRDTGEQLDLLGPPNAFAAFPEIWFQANDSDSDRAAIDDAMTLTMSLLAGASVSGPNGTNATIVVASRMGVDAGIALSSVEGMVRLQVAGLWGAS